MIERTKVLVETPLKTRGVTMITVSEVKGNYHFNDNALGGYCIKHPIALAIVTSKGVKAFAIDGNEMEINEFFQEFPETRPLLGIRPRRRKNNTGDNPLKP
jgi:uncharacterized spore protein YtfJ